MYILRFIFQNTNKTPGYIFGLLYLFCIPLFAAFYTFSLQEEFYHSTLTLEPSFEMDKIKLLKYIKKDIAENYMQTNSSNFYEFDGWKTDISDITLVEIEISDPSLKFKAILTFKYQEGDLSHTIWGNNVNVRFSCEIENVSPMRYFKKHGDGESKFTNIQILNCKKDTNGRFLNQYSFKKIFPWNPQHNEVVIQMERNAFGTVTYPNYDGLLLPFSVETQPLYKSIVKAKRGIPDSLSGRFWRMFYFSAVTITTLGYGDIVPLTENARITVAIESFIGIVLIGLFLNSTARSYSKKELNE